MEPVGVSTCVCTFIDVSTAPTILMYVHFGCQTICTKSSSWLAIRLEYKDAEMRNRGGIGLLRLASGGSYSVSSLSSQI